MKAIICEKYGSPDVLKLKEIEKPVPGDNELLIRVRAASINSADHRTMRATPFFVRFMGEGFLKPKRAVPGIDMAGVVEEVGKDVTQFQPGDAVFGDIYSSGTGSYQEYVCAAEDANIVPIPEGITFEQAASVPVAGLTALQALRDFGTVKEGDKVLVNGASGGVGTFTVLVAKAFGADVTGVCSNRNKDLIQSIGADKVIDYGKQDVNTLNERFDVIIDVAATITPNGYRRLLTPDGRGVLVGYSSILGMLRVMRAGKRAKKKGITFGAMGMAKANRDDLNALGDMMASGALAPAIDRVYPLEEAAEAMRYFDEEHARAKVVLSVGS